LALHALVVGADLSKGALEALQRLEIVADVLHQLRLLRVEDDAAVAFCRRDLTCPAFDRWAALDDRVGDRIRRTVRILAPGFAAKCERNNRRSDEQTSKIPHVFSHRAAPHSPEALRAPFADYRFGKN